MGKYDIAVRCEQIKEMIKENQYMAAMEEIEEIDFSMIPSIADIYLFADIFLKAEKLDIAKELYYTVYRRTASRPALLRLLMLVIRMGDLEEARELYLAYEIVAGMTLDTYELRYRLAKAEGEPGSRLIEILEQLKQEEYTEEWGFQLAKLYEIEGMREECIRECEDLELWFGEGPIVEKARALKQKCMSPLWVKPTDGIIPEPEPVQVEKKTAYAYAPAKVEDILVSSEEENKSEQAEEEGPEEKEEPEEPEEKEEKVIVEEDPQEPQEKEEEPSVENDLEPEDAPEDDLETEDAPEDGSRPEGQGFFRKLINYFKVDVDMFEEEIPDEEASEEKESTDTNQQQSTEEINAKALLAEAVNDVLDEQPSIPEARAEALEVEKTKKIPVESLEERLQAVEEKKEVIRLDEEMNQGGAAVKSHPLGKSSQNEFYEEVSRNGIHYLTLKGAIYRLQKETGTIHFAITGGAEGISLAVAKRLFKELKKNGYFEAKNIGKIDAEKLDEVDLEEWAEKFVGGCMYILNAPSLSEKSVKALIWLMEKYEKNIVIILEGSYDEMDSFFNYHKDFEKKILYKIRL